MRCACVGYIASRGAYTMAHACRKHNLYEYFNAGMERYVSAIKSAKSGLSDAAKQLGSLLYFLNATAIN